MPSLRPFSSSPPLLPLVHFRSLLHSISTKSRSHTQSPLILLLPSPPPSPPSLSLYSYFLEQPRRSHGEGRLPWQGNKRRPEAFAPSPHPELVIQHIIASKNKNNISKNIHLTVSQYIRRQGVSGTRVLLGSESVEELLGAIGAAPSMVREEGDEIIQIDTLLFLPRRKKKVNGTAEG